MRAPYRFEIRLRRGADGRLQCKPDRLTRQLPPPDWRDIDLSLDEVYDPEETRTFRDLSDALAGRELEAGDIGRLLPPRIQRRIGRRLFVALFGPDARPVALRRIHILPEPGEGGETDEALRDFVLRMPWGLLTQGGDEGDPFLALRGTAITVQAAHRRNGEPIVDEVTLPLRPNLLLICTDPDPDEPDRRTGGSGHRDRLRKALASHYGPHMDRVRSARTFREVEALLVDEHFRPHIVYFYGHARVRGGDTILAFDPSRGDDGEHAVEELEHLLTNHLLSNSGFPPIVWINACQTGAALRSALRVLGPCASAVIATRSVILAEHARELGLGTLRRIVVNGTAPPLALRDTLLELARDVEEFVSPAWWAITFMAVQYRLWTMLSPEVRSAEDAESAGDLPLRLDRTRQLLALRAGLEERLAPQPGTEPPAAHAILWHGTAEDGLLAFGRRLDDHLAEEFQGWPALSYRVDLQPEAWPRGDVEAAYQHFLDCVVPSLRHLPSGAAGFSPGDLRREIQRLADDRPRLIVFDHGSFSTANLDLLRAYLDFWRSRLRAWKRAPEAADPVPARTRILLFFAFDGDPLAGDDDPFEPAGGQNANRTDFARLLDPPLLVPLDLVGREEVERHLAAFERFYILVTGDPREEIDRLVAEPDDLRFRRLYQKLERMLGVTLRDRNDV